jgi:hypothetical protein
MTYTMVKIGKVFNSAHILAFNIFHKDKESLGMKKPRFFMSSYLIDVICSSIHFPAFIWDWNPIQPPVHVYY